MATEISAADARTLYNDCNSWEGKDKDLYDKVTTDVKNLDAGAILDDCNKAKNEGILSEKDLSIITEGINSTEGGCKTWEAKDNTGYETFKKDAAKGDGNAMVDDIVAGVKSGALTKEQAASIGGEIQDVANQNGGGKINGTERDKLKEALGRDDDVITAGKHKWQVQAENFFKGLAKTLFG